MNPKVDFFFNKAKQWKQEYEELRDIVLECGLTEDLKWGQPCYMLDGKNVVLIHGFKEYCALLFMKGALLNDPKDMLIQQTENVQSARQIRFTSLAEVVKLRTALKAYIKNAIEIERAGLKMPAREKTELQLPEELTARLNEWPELKAAFNALTPGRQRAYVLHFAAPKQSKTRESRIEKCAELILAGKGLND